MREKIYKEWQSQWIAGGMKWHSRGSSPPKGWDAVAQVRAVIQAGEKH